MPLFGEFSRSSWDLCESDYDSHKSQDDRWISPKSGMWILVLLMEMTEATIWRCWERRIVFFNQKALSFLSFPSTRRTQNAKCHCLANWANRPGICANHNQIRTNPGTIGWIRQKVACEFSNFKRLKNREDSFDFDDFWTKLIAPTRTFFFEIFALPENFRVAEKFSRRRTKERPNERTNLV